MINIQRLTFIFTQQRQRHVYIICTFSVCRIGVVIQKQYREVVEQDNRTHNHSFKTPPLCRHKNAETAFPCKFFLTQIRVQRLFPLCGHAIFYVIRATTVGKIESETHTWGLIPHFPKRRTSFRHSDK